MAEVERILVEEGYEVVSWRSLLKDGDALLAASQLGVDVVFQINSSERLANASEWLKRTYSYFEADSKWRRGGPRRLSPEEQDQVRAIFGNTVLPGAMVDVTVVDPNQRHAIWMYRGQRVSEAIGERWHKLALVSDWKGVKVQPWHENPPMSLRNVILHGSQRAGWDVVRESPGRVLVLNTWGQHKLRAMILYDGGSIRVRYLNSENLHETWIGSVVKAHRVVNKKLYQLSRHIREALSDPRFVELSQKERVEAHEVVEFYRTGSPNYLRRIQHCLLEGLFRDLVKRFKYGSRSDLVPFECKF
jgi:hypothetical protein